MTYVHNDRFNFFSSKGSIIVKMQYVALSWLLHSGEFLGRVRFICGGRQDSVGENGLVQLLEHTEQKANLTIGEYSATELESGRQDGSSTGVCVLASHMPAALLGAHFSSELNVLLTCLVFAAWLVCFKAKLLKSILWHCLLVTAVLCSTVHRLRLPPSPSRTHLRANLIVNRALQDQTLQQRQGWSLEMSISSPLEMLSKISVGSYSSLLIFTVPYILWLYVNTCSVCVHVT